MIVSVHKRVQRGAELSKRMELFHIKGGHPLVFKGAKPPFNLCLGSRGIGLAVIDGGTNPCCEQLHLLILISAPVIKVPYFWPAIFRDGGFHHGHEVYKGVIENTSAPVIKRLASSMRAMMKTFF